MAGGDAQLGCWRGRGRHGIGKAVSTAVGAALCVDSQRSGVTGCDGVSSTHRDPPLRQRSSGCGGRVGVRGGCRSVTRSLVSRKVK